MTAEMAIAELAWLILTGGSLRLANKKYQGVNAQLIPFKEISIDLFFERSINFSITSSLAHLDGIRYT